MPTPVPCTNINFLQEIQYDDFVTPSENEVYAIESARVVPVTTLPQTPDENVVYVVYADSE